MEHNNNYIELVYNYLLNNPKPLTFFELCKAITKKENLKSSDPVVAEIYVDLVLDNRFYLSKKDDYKWILSDRVLFDCIKKQYMEFKGYDPYQGFLDESEKNAHSSKTKETKNEQQEI